jgi:hypothetical protein
LKISSPSINHSCSATRNETDKSNKKKLLDVKNVGKS